MREQRQVRWKWLVLPALFALAVGVGVWGIRDFRGNKTIPVASTTSAAGSSERIVRHVPEVTNEVPIHKLTNTTSSTKVRLLLHSQRLADIDLALIRLSSVCSRLLSLPPSEREAHVREQMARQSLLPESYLGANGPATREQRLAALSRLSERCDAAYEGRMLSDDELIAIRAQPGFSKYRELKKSLAGPLKLDDAATLAALKTVFAEPIISSVDAVLQKHLDLSPLSAHYTPDQLAGLRYLAIAEVRCRLGEECGPGSFVVEEYCWNSGFCAETLEQAVQSQMRRSGLQTEPYRRFLDRILLSIHTQEFPRILTQPTQP